MVEKITLTSDKPIEDFAKERNKLLEMATKEWVFFVDSDEKISSELEKEILKQVQDDTFDGYLISRQDYFFGTWLKFGETGNTKLVRLGKKSAGKWVRKVHEVWDIKNIGKLRNPLLHYPHKTIADLITKINYYSEIDAKEFGYFRLWEVFVKPVGKFIQNYFFRCGLMDGMAGFVHAFMMSFQSLVVRVKQYENYH